VLIHKQITYQKIFTADEAIAKIICFGSNLYPFSHASEREKHGRMDLIQKKCFHAFELIVRNICMNGG
jgi:hypothetical protein